ncbi:MAG: O-antigen ligase family protein [Solirubrobacterales bacterium]|nr:O-antigen ligase family protein [Solirubrobacterales bacterium]
MGRPLIGLRLSASLIGVLIAIPVSVVLGVVIVKEGPTLAAAGVLMVGLGAYVIERPLNALLGAVAVLALIPYWYGHGGANVAHLEEGLALVWIVMMLVEPRERIRPGVADYAVFGLMVAAALDWWLRGGNFAALRTSFNTEVPLIFYVAGRIVAPRDSRTVLLTLVGATALASLSLFYEFAHGSPVFQDPNSYYWSSHGGAAIFRPGGLFGSPPAAVTITSMVALVAVSFFRQTTGRRRALLGAAITVMIAGGFLTFTRAGWIGFGVGVLTYFAILRWRGRIRLPRWLRIVPVAAVAVVLALPALSQTSWFQLGVKRGGTLTVRESYWTLAKRLILDSPEHLLVGRGLNSLETGARTDLGGVTADIAATPDLTINGAHNQYIRTLLEQGIVGLALVLLWVGGTVAVVMRRVSRLPASRRPVVAALAGAFVSFLVISLADTNLRDTVSFSIVSLLTGITITLCTSAQGEIA